MRKRLSTGILLLALSPLAGCQKPAPRIPVFTMTESSRSLLRLTKEDYSSLLTRKASFFLVVYQPGCGRCDAILPQLLYLSEHEKLVIPYLPKTDYDALKDQEALKDNSLVFIEAGKPGITINLNTADKSVQQLIYENTMASRIPILNDRLSSAEMTTDIAVYRFDRTFSMPERPGKYLCIQNKTGDLSKVTDSILTQTYDGIYLIDDTSGKQDFYELTVA